MHAEELDPRARESAAINQDLELEYSHSETLEVLRLAREALRRIVDMVERIEMIDPSNQSNLVNHARRQLEGIGEDPEFIEAYLEIIRLFSAQGHSGGSASVFIPTLSKLLNFENLLPITSDPEQWEDRGSMLWQNRNNSKYFSEDGGKTYYDIDNKFDDEGKVILIQAEDPAPSKND